MRVDAGDYKSLTRDGVVLNTDRPLSVEQADVVYDAIVRAGAKPGTVVAVEVTEAEWIVELAQGANYPDDGADDEQDDEDGPEHG